MDLNESVVLVTGGAGFIGSHLCDKLIALDAKVVCVDNLFTGKCMNVMHLVDDDNFVFIEGDANDENFLESVFRFFSVDYVFHYAAILGVQRVIEQPLLVLQDIKGIENILKLSKEYGVKKVIFSSSSEAYGFTAELPLVEDAGKEIQNSQGDNIHLYALVKLMGEKIMKTYNDKYGLPTCSLRFFNVFGPRQESSAYGFVVGVFIQQLLSGESPTIFGDGYQTRDFIYVDDNVRLSVKALLSEKTNGEVINIGVGRQTTILDLAQRLIAVSGRKVEPIFIDTRKSEIRYRSPDTTKMRRLLESNIPDRLDENLRRTYESYLARS